MSEQSEGPGYWQASDGLWYPPEEHPGYADAQREIGDVPPQLADVPATDATYPARLTVQDDNQIARWRVIAHPFMAIPHFLALYLIGIIGQVLVVLSWFIILITGKLPDSFHNFQAMRIRYSNRVTGFTILLTEEYPPFEFEMTPADGTGYPIRTDADFDAGARDRILVLVRFFLIIPHMIVLFFVMIGAYFAFIVAWFAVLFTARMPEGIRGFLIGVGRWSTRVQAYALLLTDKYPPFSLD